MERWGSGCSGRNIDNADAFTSMKQGGQAKGTVPHPRLLTSHHPEIPPTTPWENLFFPQSVLP